MRHLRHLTALAALAALTLAVIAGALTLTSSPAAAQSGGPTLSPFMVCRSAGGSVAECLYWVSTR